MPKLCFFLFFILLLNTACTVKSIPKTRYYHLAGSRWPTLFLRKDSTFQFNYLAPGRTKFTAADQFSGKYFSTSGNWKLNKGVLTLTSSPDDGKHDIISIDHYIEVTDGKPNGSTLSEFIFSDIWGDTVEISQAAIIYGINSIKTDISAGVFKHDISSNAHVLIFYFKNYQSFTYFNKEQVNKDFYFELKPARLDSFFRDEKIRITRRKLSFINRELELIKEE